MRLSWLAVRQQHAQLLAMQCLDMHRTIKPRPHHLRNAARVVAVGLVDLRLQHCPHVPRLDTDHRQARFGERVEQPLRQRSSFQSNPRDVPGRVLQHSQQRLGLAYPKRTFDALADSRFKSGHAAFGVEVPDGKAKFQQERAYISPIWYTPSG
jgi:hypothetical protein